MVACLVGPVFPSLASERRHLLAEPWTNALLPRSLSLRLLSDSTDIYEIPTLCAWHSADLRHTSSHFVRQFFLSCEVAVRASDKEKNRKMREDWKKHNKRINHLSCSCSEKRSPLMFWYTARVLRFPHAWVHTHVFLPTSCYFMNVLPRHQIPS